MASFQHPPEQLQDMKYNTHHHKPMEEESDEELVHQVVRGSIQTYSLLVARYERPVFNLMYRFCRSESQAADLCQDVFLRAYERLDRFDRTRKFFPWLYTMAMNLAKDWQRSHVRKVRTLDQLRWEAPAAGTDSQQEEHLLGNEEIKRLYSALDVLPDTTREMIILRYRREVSVRELAEIFQLSESGVKMRISRALERLKSVLGGKRHEE